MNFGISNTWIGQFNHTNIIIADNYKMKRENTGTKFELNIIRKAASAPNELCSLDVSETHSVFSLKFWMFWSHERMFIGMESEFQENTFGLYKQCGQLLLSFKYITIYNQSLSQ
jgi:hypothetical protein